jgi:bacillithiol system protein YtxJ
VSFLASPAAQRVDHAWVRVIQERPVSLALAERVGMQHQSPQALLIHEGRAVWSASHRAITSAALQNAAAAATVG